MTGGSIGTLALGSTLWTTPVESTGSTPVPSSAAFGDISVASLPLRPGTADDILARWRMENCDHVSAVTTINHGLLTVFGRPSMPTLKSHKSNLQSSPTLPKR